MSEVSNLLSRYYTKGIIIDTNILLLYLVGRVNRERIPRFKRTQQFIPEDYDLLLRLVENFQKVVTTPNILTEVNSLANQLGKPEKTRCLITFTWLISQITEEYIESEAVASNDVFSRFGLTDCGIMLLTKDEKNELLPSGGEGRFYNRVGWARTYLKKAGLLSYPRRGFFSITPRGEQLLANSPEAINAKFLRRYDEFVKFVEIKSANNSENKIEEDKLIVETPEEILESAHQKLIDNLSGEIIENIKKCSPYFFEHLVVDLLVSMGYGGSRKEAGQAVGKSGEEGIDGIIKEDRLGLNIIYIQAKRWDNVVGRPEIQKFAGALLGQSAKKGIFITTSDFSKGEERPRVGVRRKGMLCDAVDYVTRIDSKIILVNGDRLAELMIEHDIGVTSIARYEVKRIDSDYFIE